LSAYRACRRLPAELGALDPRRTSRAPVSLREKPPGSGGLNVRNLDDHSETARVADYPSPLRRPESAAAYQG